MADAVEAAESAVTWTERRLRLERSLHDGAQQHLLAIQIALVEASLPESDTRWSEVASTLRRQLVGAIDEIRSLADGNAPLQFVAGDVVGSILRLGAASPLRVVADLPDSVPASWWERHVYELCAEALHNAAVSGAATAAEIALRVGEDVVALTVTDDGVGGARIVVGHGLDGHRGRFAAAAGTLTVGDVPGSAGEVPAGEVRTGTIVRGTLPVVGPGHTARPGAATERPGPADGTLDLATRRSRALDRMVSIRLSVGSLEPLVGALALLDGDNVPVERAAAAATLAEVRAAVDVSSEALRLVVRRLQAWVPDDPSLALDALLGDAAHRSRTTCSRVLDGEPDPPQAVLIAAVAEEAMFGLGAGSDISVVLRRRSGAHRVRIRFDGILPASSVAVMEDLLRGTGSEPTVEAGRGDALAPSTTRIEFEVPCAS